MAHLDFKEPVAREQEDASVVAHNTRIGVFLFIVYVLIYGGFVLLSAFRHDLMARPVLAGANLAVVYGFSLIVAAIILALIYMKVCRKTPVGRTQP